jgi:small-conductance mechanosensitive channel/CRP-like cAMP-binding protein
MLSNLVDPLILASVLVILGFMANRLYKDRVSFTYFTAQALFFAAITALMFAGEVTPYHPNEFKGSEVRRLFIGTLQVVWWLVAAWLAVGFSRVFLLYTRRPRDSKLLQELLEALIYLAAGITMVDYVFDLPIKGLLATSGALAIIIGLALQSSLADVFSGVVLDLERPYCVGDWISLDETAQGVVIEMNWRATHILTGNHDVVVVPNSVISKAKLVNFSAPTRAHGSSLKLRLAPVLSPAKAREMMKDVLVGCSEVLQTPSPSVAVKDITGDAIEVELSFSVKDVSSVASAQTEVLDRAYSAILVAGCRLAGSPATTTDTAEHLLSDFLHEEERILRVLPIFTMLSPSERAKLQGTISRKNYDAGEVVARAGASLHSLGIVGSGVLLAVAEDHELAQQLKLTAGQYFGQSTILGIKPPNITITAQTRAAVYYIDKEYLVPLCEAHPLLTESLNQSLIEMRPVPSANSPVSNVSAQSERLPARFAGWLRQLRWRS